MGYGIWDMAYGMGWGVPSSIFQVRPLGWRHEVRFDVVAQEPVQ